MYEQLQPGPVPQSRLAIANSKSLRLEHAVFQPSLCTPGIIIDENGLKACDPGRRGKQYSHALLGVGFSQGRHHWSFLIVDEKVGIRNFHCMLCNIRHT